MQKSTNNNDYEVLTVLLEYSLLLEYTDNILPTTKRGFKHFLNNFEVIINKDLDTVFESLSEQDDTNTFPSLLSLIRESLSIFSDEQAIYYLIIDMKKRIEISNDNVKLKKLKSFLNSYEKHILVQFPKLDRNSSFEFFNLNNYITFEGFA